MKVPSPWRGSSGTPRLTRCAFSTLAVSRSAVSMTRASPDPSRMEGAPTAPAVGMASARGQSPGDQGCGFDAPRDAPDHVHAGALGFTETRTVESITHQKAHAVVPKHSKAIRVAAFRQRKAQPPSLQARLHVDDQRLSREAEARSDRAFEGGDGHAHPPAHSENRANDRGPPARPKMRRYSARRGTSMVQGGPRVERTAPLFQSSPAFALSTPFPLSLVSRRRGKGGVCQIARR